MRLVGIAVIRNEADIVEPFVRHTLALLDALLVVDHASTDGTRDVLLALVREGLPLQVHGDEVLANLQQKRCRLLFEKAWAEQAADWVLPLDADEILVVRDREHLEAELAAADGQPLALPLLNYCATQGDDESLTNPLRRIQYRAAANTTVKLCLPRTLVWDERLVVGKGNHAVIFDGRALPARRADGVALAHFALRSPAQQAVRIVTGELQKLSRGREWHGLDVHYRPGFELLLRSPEVFAANLAVPLAGLVYAPVDYRGGPLRHPVAGQEVGRAIRALLPLCERLARAHGALLDAVPITQRVQEEDTPCPRLLDSEPEPALPTGGGGAFSGFVAVAGWEPEEGPVAEAFLPRFHWATGPETVLEFERPIAGRLSITMEMLTYCSEQVLEVEHAGVVVARVEFPQAYYRLERRLTLDVPAGRGRLVLRFAHWLSDERDPRRLAVIFLRLVVRA